MLRMRSEEHSKYIHFETGLHFSFLYMQLISSVFAEKTYKFAKQNEPHEKGRLEGRPENQSFLVKQMMRLAS